MYVSSNPLDRHLDTLKQAEPRPQAVERAVAVLGRRSRPLPRLLVLGSGIALVSGIVLWPRGTSGVAWAQIASQTTPPMYVMRAETVRNGHATPIFEIRVDRTTNRYRMRNVGPMGAAESARQADGTYRMLDSEFIYGPMGHYMRLHGIASFSKQRRQGLGPLGQQPTLDDLLKQKDVRQLGVDANAETRVGKVDRYRLEQPGASGDGAAADRQPFEVYVEPNTKRVLGWDIPGRDGSIYRTTISYPTRMPDSDFAFPLDMNVPTFDLDAIDAWARKTLQHPLAALSAGGHQSQLRLVVQEPRKALWVLWSGTKPNGDLRDHAKVLGLPNGTVYGLAGFARKGDGQTQTALGGHAIQLDRKVDFVDLKVPVFVPDGEGHSKCVGYSIARHIPVKQVPGVDATWGAIGVKRPFR